MSFEMSNREVSCNIHDSERDPLITFKNILGKERVEQYETYGMHIQTAYDYFRGKIVGTQAEGVLVNLIGYEFNLYIMKLLKENNGKNIRREVRVDTEFGTTAIDCVATFDVAQKFTRVLPSLKEEPFYIQGECAFENKATRKLYRGTSKQLQKAKTIYPSANYFILADTRVKPGACKNLYNAGLNVLRADITRKDLIDNLLNIQKQMYMQNLCNVDSFQQVC